MRKSGDRGTKSEPKGTKSEPKGSQWEVNGSQSSTKMQLKNNVRKRSRKRVPKRHTPPHVFWEHFWEYFPSKMHSKIDAKLNVEKLWTFIRKWSQNDANTMSENDDKSMIFRNLRFLDFFEEYNVYFVVQDRWYQKSLNISYNIKAKSMFDKCMQKS